MLFNSYEFLAVFLPVVLAGFCLLRNATSRLWWLTGASLFFYGWWNPPYLLLLLASMLGNFGTGKLIAASPPRGKKALVVLGVLANLGLLGYYKYAGFLAGAVGYLAGTDLGFHNIVLPLAISFFTFQQLAWLVDSYRSGRCDDGLVEYIYFVTFFPQLIAGPIVHHGEIVPQIPQLQPTARGWTIGITMLTLGLAKKMLVADAMIPAVSKLFEAAGTTTLITAGDAWLGTLAYAMQLYFDFSGYSDMAIGLGAFFGVTIPVNFASPYRSTSIIEFWRRWHITLSRFLRDYLYIPLGGGRCSQPRQLMNLAITMLLGGLWHGAGWTFLFWGGLHGVYLIVNRLWRQVAKPAWCDRVPTWAKDAAGWSLTFLAVLLGWVFFRAGSFAAAGRILSAMVGMAGGGVELFLVPGEHVPLILAASLLAWFAPNTQQIIAGVNWLPDNGESPQLAPSAFRFEPNWRWACIVAGLIVASAMQLSSVSEFLYFQF